MTRSSRRFADLAWTYGLPAVIAVVQIVGSLGASHAAPGAEGRRPLDWFAFVLLLIGPALLVGRLRWPVAVLAGVSAVSLTYALVGYEYGPFVLAFISAVVTAVRIGHRIAAWAATVLLLGVHFAAAAFSDLSSPPTGRGMVTVGGWLLVVLIGAEASRFQLLRAQERRRTTEAESARRVTAERLRIARDLHDVVAHNMSLISVQAGVALHLMDREPEQARTALTTIKQASKEALVEMRSILGVLRQVDEPAGDSTSGVDRPGLDRLDELGERARQAGLATTVEVSVDRSVPTAVQDAAYRIVQEAVTNALRHAHARRVEIRLAEDGDRLTVAVEDDGRGSAAPDSGETSGGSGLIGMRERAAAMGGTVRTGDRPGGGFAVYAELPLDRWTSLASESSTAPDRDRDEPELDADPDGRTEDPA